MIAFRDRRRRQGSVNSSRLCTSLVAFIFRFSHFAHFYLSSFFQLRSCFRRSFSYHVEWRITQGRTEPTNKQQKNRPGVSVNETKRGNKHIQKNYIGELGWIFYVFSDLHHKSCRKPERRRALTHAGILSNAIDHKMIMQQIDVWVFFLTDEVLKNVKSFRNDRKKKARDKGLTNKGNTKHEQRKEEG